MTNPPVKKISAAKKAFNQRDDIKFVQLGDHVTIKKHHVLKGLRRLSLVEQLGDNPLTGNIHEMPVGANGFFIRLKGDGRHALRSDASVRFPLRVDTARRRWAYLNRGYEYKIKLTPEIRELIKSRSEAEKKRGIIMLPFSMLGDDPYNRKIQTQMLNRWGPFERDGFVTDIELKAEARRNKPINIALAFTAAAGAAILAQVTLARTRDQLKRHGQKREFLRREGSQLASIAMELVSPPSPASKKLEILKPPVAPYEGLLFPMEQKMKKPAVLKPAVSHDLPANLDQTGAEMKSRRSRMAWLGDFSFMAPRR